MKLDLDNWEWTSKHNLKILEGSQDTILIIAEQQILALIEAIRVKDETLKYILESQSPFPEDDYAREVRIKCNDALNWGKDGI